MAAVLVTSRSFGSCDVDGVARLNERGLTVVRGDAGHGLSDLEPHLATASAWIAGVGPVTESHLALAPDLRLVARYGVGVDSVDLAACADRGVVVTNTPGANSNAVAEHTLALLFALLRSVADGDHLAREGKFPRLVGREVRGMTVGVIGLGHVGSRVAELLTALGAVVLGNDREPAVRIDSHAVERVDIDTLLDRSDVVTLHLPSIGRSMIDESALGRMREGALLVNTARADLTDVAAVRASLLGGHLGGFAADVLELGDVEQLKDAPNTVFTPHNASQTRQSIDRMTEAVISEVISVIVDGREPSHAVVAQS